MPDEPLFYFNGVNGATGEYLLAPRTPKELAALALGDKLDPELKPDLEERGERARTKKLGAVFGVKIDDLEEAGWGVIFPQGGDPRIYEALKLLLDLRRGEAGERYREYRGADGYRRGETKNAFLARHGMGPGPADPEKVPYYLLIVGSPEEISFHFQYQLDVQYAVGRLHFDTLDEYARYAQSVVAAASGKIALPRRAAFVGVQNEGDPATELSATQLVAPLAEKLAKTPSGKAWTIETHLREEATKARLLDFIGGKDTPAFLFTASHGMAFPNNDSRQREHQGALLAQDMSFRNWRGSIPQTMYVAGDDISSAARLFGLISFHFACYGAGTPNVDDFPYAMPQDASLIPAQPYVARLPQRLLAHPNGGALAAIGHVERAWGYSFLWDGAGAQLGAFSSALGAILKGLPVGAALEYMNGRYAELATDLAAELEEARKRRTREEAIAALWTANNDARSYVILGDPAVRLPLSPDTSATGARPMLVLQPAPSEQPSAAAVSPQPVPAGAAVPTPSAAAGAVIVTYGWTDNLSQVSDKLVKSIEDFANRLGDLVKRTADDVTRLEVATYVSEDMSGVEYDRNTKKFTGDVSLRALTTMELEGDTLVVVPRRAEAVDEALWKIHSDTVAQAQGYRTELIKAVVSAAAGLVSALKPGG